MFSTALAGIAGVGDDCTFKTLHDNSVDVWKGTGAPTLSSTSKRYVEDFENQLVEVPAGTPAFPGLRCVTNIIKASGALTDATYWGSYVLGSGAAATCTAGQTAPDGTATAFRVQTNRVDTSSASFWRNTNLVLDIGSYRYSIWIKSNTGVSQTVNLDVAMTFTITATTEWQRVSPETLRSITMNGTSNVFSIGSRNTSGQQVIDVLVWQPQIEKVTGQTNRNPGEYVPTTSTNAVTKWFATTNPNAMEPTFSRSGTAYKADGTVVASGMPRLETGKFGNAIMVEEGTTNIAVNPGFDTNVIGWNNPHPGEMTISWDPSGAVKCLITATPILVPSGGGGINQSTIATSATPHTLTMRIWASKAGLKLFVRAARNSAWRTDEMITTAASIYGWQTLTATVPTSNATTSFTMRGGIYDSTNLAVGDYVLIDWVQLEAKPYATSFINGTRVAEQLTVPFQGIGTASDFTISMWAKALVDNNYYQTLFTFGADPTNLLLTINPNGVDGNVEFWNQPGLIKSVSTGLSCVTWHHYCVVFSNGNTIKLYVDGVYKDQFTYVWATSHTLLYIGCRSSSMQYLNGLIDDLKISKIARSATEILADYNSTSAAVRDLNTTYLHSFDSFGGNNTVATIPTFPLHPVTAAANWTTELLSYNQRKPSTAYSLGDKVWALDAKGLGHWYTNSSPTPVELIANGTFDSGLTTGWTNVYNSAGTLDIDAGRLRFTQGPTGGSYFGCVITGLTVGKSYYFSTGYVGGTMADKRCTLATTNIGGGGAQVNTNTVFSFGFVSPATTLYLNYSGNNSTVGQTLIVDNISLKESTSLNVAQAPVELLANPSFDAQTGWLYTGANHTITGGQVTITPAGVYHILFQSPTMTVGKTYTVTVDVASTNTVGGTVTLACSGVVPAGTYLTAAGVYTFTGVATAITQFLITLNAVTSGSLVLNSCSVIEVNPMLSTGADSVDGSVTWAYGGLYRSKGGLLVEPVATNKCTCYSVPRADSLGAEKVSNGGFDTDTLWVKGTNWGIAGGVLTSTGANAGQVCSQNIAMSAGKFYQITYTISGYTAGTVRVQPTNTGNIGTERSANGTYTENLQPVSGSAADGYLYIFSGATAFQGSIDNVSVKEIIDYAGTKAFYANAAFLNPLTNITPSGDTTAVLTIVSDSTAIAAAGLTGMTNSGKVYKLDNSLATAVSVARIAGTTTNVNRHSISAYARRASGVGVSSVRSGYGLVPQLITNNAYTRLVANNFTPGGATECIDIQAGIGDVIYFLLPQLEELTTATTPVLTAGASATRAATTLSYPVTNNLRTTGTRHISLSWTPQNTKAGIQQMLWSTKVDANNFTAIWVSNTTVAFEKRVAGLCEFVTYEVSPVVGVTYKIDAYLYADNTMGLAVDEVLQTGTLGTELVADPSFDTPAAWAYNATSGWAVNGSKMNVTAATINNYALAVNCIAGRCYLVSIDVESISAGGLNFTINGGLISSAAAYTPKTLTGAINTHYISGGACFIRPAGATTCVLDNYSVKQIYNNSTTLPPAIGTTMVIGGFEGATLIAQANFKNVTIRSL